MKKVFHFIACSNRPLLMDECLRYIRRLYVPEGWETEITVITDAKSMCEGYNRAIGMQPGDVPRVSDSRIRIYLHQDVYIINRWLLHNLLTIFEAHPDIGMTGMAGTPKMHPSGVWWNGDGVGCLYQEGDDAFEEERLAANVSLTDVDAIDGFLMATSVDVPWREDLFDGFDFYDVSQSYEIRNAGYRVVVPEMLFPCCVHDDGRVLSLYHYNRYRRIFLAHYGRTSGFCTNGLQYLSFPPSFFEDEVRDGFFVCGMMKRYWAAALRVLSEIDRVCQAHGIPWFMDAGTLLGAVRHQGFIPWDDDVDIIMMRHDLDRFLAVAAEELPEGYLVCNIQTDPSYENTNARVINSAYIDASPERMQTYFGCPYTVGIDIFALDGIHEDGDAEVDRRLRLNDLYVAAGLVGGGEGDTPECRALLDKISAENNMTFRADVPLFSQLLQMEVRLFREVPADGAPVIGMFFGMDDLFVFPPEDFQEQVYLPFEGVLLPAPVAYDHVLKTYFGDYHRIVRGGSFHDYPSYSGQEDMLRQAMNGNHPYRYTLTATDLSQKGQRTSGPEAHPQGQKDIVFLVCRAAWWPVTESLWRKACILQDVTVHIIPVPWYEKTFMGQRGEKHDERNLFPENLPLTMPEDYDLSARTPRMIITCFPYDSTNQAIDIDPCYYSCNIRECTDQLVFVPCLQPDVPAPEDEAARKMWRVYVEQPAFVFADNVVVTDEDVKRLSIDTLTEIAGEDTRPVWETKITTAMTDLWARRRQR